MFSKRPPSFKSFQDYVDFAINQTRNADTHQLNLSSESYKLHQLNAEELKEESGLEKEIERVSEQLKALQAQHEKLLSRKNELTIRKDEDLPRVLMTSFPEFKSVICKINRLDEDLLCTLIIDTDKSQQDVEAMFKPFLKAEFFISKPVNIDYYGPKPVTLYLHICDRDNLKNGIEARLTEAASAKQRMTSLM